jgi:pimeloyl-ACP methyl ester carboxylesterase
MKRRRFSLWVRILCWVMIIGIMAGGVACHTLLDRGVARLTQPNRYELGTDFKKVMDRPAIWGLQVQRFEASGHDGYQVPILRVVADESLRGLDAMKSALKTRGLLQPIPESRTKKTPSHRGTIVMLHGFNSRKEHLLGISRWFVAAGYQCLLHDSRGHGDATVSQASFGQKEATDVKTVLQEAERRFGDLGPVGIYGYSMGGGVALQSLPLVPRIKAAVTVSAFADLRSVLTHQTKQHYRGTLYPMLPLLRQRVKSQAHFDPYSIRPDLAVQQVSTPILLIHGRQDQVVPFSQAEKLHHILGPNRSRLLPQTGDHAQVMTKGGPALCVEVVAFFNERL